MTERKARRDQEFTRDVETGAVIRWGPMIDWKARRTASILEKRRIDDLKRKKEEADSETKKYKVFLSFSEDTRYNFVGHLYEALIQKGIHTFIDDGKYISLELLKAIEESTFAIVILSNDYASSAWCLDELALILHCKEKTGMKILPVFHYVDPSDIRKKLGTFEQAFIEHEEKKNKERVEKWRDALRQVSSLVGCHLGSRYETEDIKDIMGWISLHLKEEETAMKAEMRAMKNLDLSNLPPRGKIEEAESPPSQSHPRLHLKILDSEIKEAESLPSDSESDLLQGPSERDTQSLE